MLSLRDNLTTFRASTTTNSNNRDRFNSSVRFGSKAAPRSPPQNPHPHLRQHAGWGERSEPHHRTSSLVQSRCLWKSLHSIGSVNGHGQRVGFAALTPPYNVRCWSRAQPFNTPTPISASIPTIRPACTACSLDALPCSARLATPCAMAARRKKLKARTNGQSTGIGRAVACA